MAASALFWMDKEKSVPLLLDTLDREFKMLPSKRGTMNVGFRGEEEVITACSDWLGLAPKTCAPAIAAYLGKGNRDLDYCLAELLLRMDYAPYRVELLIDGATKCTSLIVRCRIIYRLWKIDDPRVEPLLKEALKDQYSEIFPRTGKTIYPIRSNAQDSLKKLEAKVNGLDPLAEEHAKIERWKQSQQSSKEKK